MYPSLDASVNVGTVLAGKYRVERVLGAGGMGVVVAATHLELGQLVALKFIRSEALQRPETIARFEREVRAAVRLKSEHVARVIDVGRLETGSPYIVMEYLEGQDLASLLQRYGTIAVPTACGFIIQACDAIAEAHGLGIVHRDLKPGNLFLANASHGRKIVKVLDFGISKSGIAAGDLGMTRTQDVIGSPGYMSPEQMRSAKTVDGRSDIWSLGIILYELITGQVPFQADTLTALCLKIAMEPPPALPALPIAHDAEVATVIHRALEKDPALRYSSAIELAHALAPFAEAESRDLAQRLVASTAAAASGFGAMPMTPVVSTLDVATGQQHNQPERRSPLRNLRFTGVALGGATAVGIVIGLTFGARRDDVGARQPSADHPPDPGSEVARPGEPHSGAGNQVAPATTGTKANATLDDAAAPGAQGPVLIDGGVEAQASDELVELDESTMPRRAVEPPEPTRATGPRKASKPRTQKTNERDRPRDKGKPIDSFEPYSTPD